MTQQIIFRSELGRQWHELYKGWLAYAEATNEERKNGWKKLSILEGVLSGEIEPASPSLK
jgi:hypothetical protein